MHACVDTGMRARTIAHKHAHKLMNIHATHTGTGTQAQAHRHSRMQRSACTRKCSSTHRSPRACRLEHHKVVWWFNLCNFEWLKSNSSALIDIVGILLGT
eukprot:571007-Alexandrium_andersonii.AAC.1